MWNSLISYVMNHEYVVIWNHMQVEGETIGADNARGECGESRAGAFEGILYRT